MNRQFLFLLLVGIGTYCRADVILSIDPVSQTAPLGAAANFNVDISGLGNGTALGAFDINFEFDPTVLSYDSIVFGDQVDISGLGDIQSVTPGIGTVEVFELSLDSASELDSLQASAFTMATLTFSTLSTAINSPVTLSINALGDAVGNSLSTTLQNGSVSVTSTTASPEPNSVWLILAVLPIFVVIRRRFSSSKS